MELVKPQPPTIGREELAGWLHVTPEALYNKLPKLEREHGFPPKLPGSNGLWSRAVVLAWIDGMLVTSAPPSAPALPTLEQHYGSVA